MIAGNFTRQTLTVPDSLIRKGSLQTSERSLPSSAFPNHCKDVSKFLLRRLGNYVGEDEDRVI